MVFLSLINLSIVVCLIRVPWKAFVSSDLSAMLRLIGNGFGVGVGMGVGIDVGIGVGVLITLSDLIN